LLIELTKSQVSIIDNEDWVLVKEYKWYAHQDLCGKYYAVAWTKMVNGKRKLLLMHRLLLAATKGQQIDHINGNSLDNRRENLRFCNCSQNQQNRKVTSGTSLFKGVSRCKTTNRWRADIKSNGKQVFIGRFDTELEAAKAYDTKAKDLFKEFASLNNK
jgi:hypothetical protein